MQARFNSVRPCWPRCAGGGVAEPGPPSHVMRKAWRIAIGTRGWSARTIWDSRRAQWVHAPVLALPVTHPDHRDTPLWLVVCRSKGRTPWYLLTAEPITTAEDAWRVVAGVYAQMADRAGLAL